MMFPPWRPWLITPYWCVNARPCYFLPMREDLGRLIIRLAVGGLLLLHGIAKLIHGIAPIHQMLEAKGLPSVIAYGVYLGEVVAPLLVILGILTRVGGILIFLNMAIAIFLANMGELGSLNQGGGWAVELPVLYMLGGLAIFCLGPGKYAVGGRMA
jgi:putative oxidoreductase